MNTNIEGSRLTRMKFFTRKLHRRMQSTRFNTSHWTEVVSSYRAHVAAMFARLPNSARQLAGLYFHDCLLESAELLAAGRVTLRLRGNKHFYSGKRAVNGIHRLQFAGVTDTNVSLHHISRHWVYEELDVKNG